MNGEELDEVELAGRTFEYLQDTQTKEKVIKDIVKFMVDLDFYTLMNTQFPFDVKMAIVEMQNQIHEYNNALLRKEYYNEVNQETTS